MLRLPPRLRPRRIAPPRALASAGVTALLIVQASSFGLASGSARAELPPWVYGQMQRAAPLRLSLLLESSRRRGDAADVRARITAIDRQPASARLRPGQRIGVRIPLPPPRRPGFVGPAPLPVPAVGSRSEAWLAPLAGEPGWYQPVAGGYSFGPSLEDQRSPQP